MFQVQAAQDVVLVEEQDSLQQMVLFFLHSNHVQFSILVLMHCTRHNKMLQC